MKVSIINAMAHMEWGRIEFLISNHVMPAQAGDQFFRNTLCDSLGSRLRGND